MPLKLVANGRANEIAPVRVETFLNQEEAEIEANGYFSEPDWRDAVSPDGVRCFVTRISEVT